MLPAFSGEVLAERSDQRSLEITSALLPMAGVPSMARTKEQDRREEDG